MKDIKILLQNKEKTKDVKNGAMEDNESEQQSGFSLRLAQAKEKLRIPISSPAVYQPMMLITLALCIQHFSGFTFTKKFLLQVLKSPNFQKNHQSPLNNANKDTSEEISIDQKAYIFAILINFIRFISNLLMARFLRSFRIRFLYFISLFSTAVCLTILGFLEEETILEPYISHEAAQYLKVTILGVHVFCVQFGLQSLAGQLTDILLPSCSKAIMKGVIRAVQALTLLLFVTLMKQLEQHWSFWFMAIGLICVSPLLFTYIPELKNLGRTAGEFFFLPCQTVFYVVLPLPVAKRRFCEAVQKVKSQLFAANVFSKDILQSVDHQRSYMRWKSVEVTGNDNRNVTLTTDTIEKLRDDKHLQAVNRDRVNFVTNILGQNGFLNCNEEKSRLCIGRGPITFFEGAIKNGAIFLFNDLVIVARKLVANRRYIDENVFQFSDNFKIAREGPTLTLSSAKTPIGLKIHVETENNASLWEKYCNFSVENWNKDPEEDPLMKE